MDLLTKYNACINIRKKIVVFRPSEEEEFTFVGMINGLRTPIILTLKARRLY